MDEIKRKHIKLLSEIDNNLKRSLINYTDESYRSVNEGLRTKSILSTESLKIAKDIDSIFDLIEPINQTLTLYRGVSEQSHAQTDGAFISTTYDEKVAHDFTKGKCCILVINVPPGSKILFVESISDSPDECEVLLDRNGTFNITLVQEAQGLNKTRIFITYIPPMSVVSTSQNLPQKVEKAIIVGDYISRVVDVFPEDEYSLFKDDEEVLNSSIIDIFTKIAQTIPNSSIVSAIRKRLAIKYV